LWKIKPSAFNFFFFGHFKYNFNLYQKSVPQTGLRKTNVNVLGKAIPVQVWTGPEASRRLRLPDFKTVGK
jgi:hypothetical protein